MRTHVSARRPAPLRAARAAMALLLSMGPAPMAGAQQPDAAARGCELYMQVKFDDAIAVIEAALARQELVADRLLQARVCLARAYFKQGDAAHSRETFKSVLRMDPTWRPDPVEIPPDEILAFESALAEFEAARTAAPAPEPAAAPATPPASTTSPPASQRPAATVPTETPQVRPQPTVPAVPSMAEGGGGSIVKKWWFWGLAVGVGTGVALLAGGGGDDGGAGQPGPLPGFPPPPPTP